MTTVHIPENNEGVLDQLGEVGRLISAKKWERAALITALVGPPRSSGRPKKGSVMNFSYTPDTLAVLGIHGLRSKVTIIYYRDQWCKHRDVPALGDDVDLDGLPEWVGMGTSAKEKEQVRRENQPVPDSLTYPSPIKTHPPVDDVPVDYEELAAREHREELADRLRDRADANRHGGMRLVPDVEVTEPTENDRQKAMAGTITKLVHAKHDMEEVIEDAGTHMENLHPGTRDHFTALIEDLSALVQKLRAVDAEYEKELSN